MERTVQSIITSDLNKIICRYQDSVIINGYQLFHNYIRPHMALNGKTPAEKCGIEIKGDNKWITLIQNASRK
ncbi:MAG: hypothetical protein YK1309IOTA_1470013 [Marine Group I thaumarchaeote]|nr:MAG: hypothetical protein YK1309IOTA_1470013 [Marine Group I thaumarchaeote]